MACPESPVRFKHRLEYHALRNLEQLLRPLPHGFALTVGWLFARLAFHLFRFRRLETLKRIQQVFPAPTASGWHQRRRRNARIRRIAWLSLRNTVFNAVEMLQADRATLNDLRCRIQGLDKAAARMHSLIKAHGGLVIAIPHMGNWDQAGIGCTLAGVPVFSIAARQRNPLVNAMIQRLRRGPAGMEILERGAGTMRQVLRRLHQGEALAILPDVRMRHTDLAVSFLGKTCNLGRGMAQFARSAHVPILPVLVTRKGWRRQSIRCADPVFPDSKLDKSVDCARMTGLVMAQVETAIRAEPEQWFWYNRRWIGDPVPPEPLTITRSRSIHDPH